MGEDSPPLRSYRYAFINDQRYPFTRGRRQCDLVSPWIRQTPPAGRLYPCCPACCGQHEEVQAAPLTDTWKLGGNSGVLANGTNFLGTKNVAPLIFKTAATNNTPLERMRITETGNVGIGITTPAAKLQVYSTTYAIFARHTAASGSQPGVQGETAATAAGASGVLGKVMSTAPGANSAGVVGQNNGTNSNGTGVRGTHAGTGHGVHGTSVGQNGVRGDGSTGVLGIGTTTGVSGSGSGNATGVYGEASSGAAVWGRNYYGGIAMKAEGSAVQSAHQGGWAKALLRMQGDGTFVSAYNGVTGASGYSAGFTITSQGGGYYVIDFGSGIDTQYRYFSLSGSSTIILTSFPATTKVQIFVGNASYGYAYYILVF